MAINKTMGIHGTHIYTHIYIYTYHTYIYNYIYIHTTRIQGVWNDWTDTVDVCHFLWLFYDGGSLCYIIQPICVYVLDCLSLSLPHYIPMIFPKMVIRLNYLKFLCYRIIWLIYIYPIKFPYVPILSNESTFFLQKKNGSFEALPRGCHCDELFRTLTAAQGTWDIDLTNWRCYHQQLAFPVAKMMV
jgi:hypothetical protein